MTRTPGSRQPIAVVGIGCRFPGASSPTAFWELLCRGGDAIVEVPPSRFDIDEIYDPMPGTPERVSSRWGGFIEDVEKFDAAFFQIGRHEAARMDPQQRLLLEVAWEAFEDAGVAPKAASAANTGVFLGINASDYDSLLHRDVVDTDLFTTTGGSRNAAAGRVSFLLGLQGPSMVVDTDRSSSLVAVHLACRSIWSGECDSALAGGSNLVLSPQTSIGFSRASMLAADGRCKFCDASADGFVRSDGVGVVLLKPLADAIADGNPVYAVIRGSAVNSDGGRSGDLMAPSVASQVALLRSAYAQAGISPGQVRYVEAHGPGTRRGDPIEVRALGEVLAEGRPLGSRCAIGSVKTNIGHAEAAAGIAGLIKVALILKHRAVPPSLHLRTPNPEIPFDRLPVFVPVELEPWAAEDGPDYAGVSSFGLTGTNAHVVLSGADTAPPVDLPDVPGRAELVTLTARDPNALRALAREYASFVRGGRGPSLASIGLTSRAFRARHDHRLALAVSSREELADRLRRFVSGDEQLTTGDVEASRKSRVAFVFPGQGSQWMGMGVQLAEEEPVFREALRECAQAISRHAGWSLTEWLASTDPRRFADIELVQPALVAIEVSLAALWRSWGVHPAAVIGTSMGEAAAACVAGHLSVDQAIQVICSRTRLMKRTSGRGGMAVVELSVDESRALLLGRESLISIAVSNSPTSTVLSGDPKALADIQEILAAEGVFCKLVKVDVASHSPQMDPLLPELMEALDGLNPVDGEIAMVSSVTARPQDGAGLTARYWADNLRNPVDFSGAVARMLEDGFDTFVEMSPHPLLLGPLLDCSQLANRTAVAFASLRRDEPERKSLLTTLGELFCHGLVDDFAPIAAPGAVKVALPTYAWQRKRYWYSKTRRGGVRLEPVRAGDLLGSPTGVDRVAHTLLGRLRDAPVGQRREIVREFVTRQVEAVIGVEAGDRLDIHRPFRELGLNSLMAVELRGRLGKAFERTLPPTFLFNYSTIDRVVSFLSDQGGHSVALIGEILVDCEVIDRAQLATAIAEQSRSTSNERLGSVLLRLGLVTPEQLQRALTVQLSEPIAIVGLACRFPGGAAEPEAFWRLLHDGVDAITEIPPTRWDPGLYSPDAQEPGRMSTRWGGVVHEVDRFDASFFGISPREAEQMDPQQRLLLEVAWEALEHAAISADTLADSPTGVFVGMMNYNDYTTLKRLPEDPSSITAHHGTGNATSIAAGRLSYTFGFKGPAIAIDTACSSSLVALHLACQSLRSGECRTALVGGVNLILSPEHTISFSKAGMMASDGRCKTFDAAADGYVRSDGCGVVVLKRLSEALATRDRILAIVSGTAVNQDGRSSGLTAPNGAAQEGVIHDALSRAGVSAEEVQYVEAHGTGTRLGDPIEMAALAAVFGEGRTSENPLLVGSVKTNIGHTEAAAGIASLIKVVLAMEHQEIPPHLHLRQPNPLIDFGRFHAVVPTARVPWMPAGGRRVAGISSFGFSGTNAHVVLHDAPVAPSKPAVGPERPLHLLALSAKDPAALREVVGRYADHLRTHPQCAIGDLCFSANTGRVHFAHRLVLTARTTEELQARLASVAAGKGAVGAIEREVDATTARQVAFLFTGQGSQYPRMGRELYETQPAFRRTIDRCSEVLQPVLERSLTSVLYGADADSGLLSDTAYTQPALFAVEYALAKLWESWGVVPAAVIGHSVGEYVAACVAGVLGFEDALRLVAERGRIIGQLPHDGTMMAVFGPESAVAAAIRPYANDVSIAAVNGPEEVVVSGRIDAVRAAAGALAAVGITGRELTVSHAFHSPLMEPILDEFEQQAAKVRFSPPKIPLISNLTGAVATPEICTPGYWRRHVREAVRFDAGLHALLEQGVHALLEVGPKPVLVSMARKSLPGVARTMASSLREGRSDWEQLLASVAELHCAGVKIDWQGFDRDYPRQKLHLPTYPFQRKRHWIADYRQLSRSVTPAPRRRVERTDALLVQRISSPGAKLLFRTRLGATTPSFVAEHLVHGMVVVPAVCYLEVVQRACVLAFGPGPHLVEDIVIRQAMVVAAKEDPREVQITLDPGEGGRQAFTIESESAEGAWTLHLTGTVRHGGPAAVATPMTAAAIEDAKAAARQVLSSDPFYAKLAALGMPLGPRFRGMRTLWIGNGAALVHAVLPPEAVPEAGDYLVHPVLVDTVLQALATLRGGELFVPLTMGSVRFQGRPTRELWAHIQLVPGSTSDEILTADVALWDAALQPVLELTNVQYKRVTRDALLRAAQRIPVKDEAIELAWRPKPLEAPVRDAGRGSEWLVFADRQGFGASVVRELAECGARCTVVEAADRYEAVGDRHFTVDPLGTEDWTRLGAELFDGGKEPHGILFLWGLDAAPTAELAQASLSRATAMACGGLSNLIRTLASRRLRRTPPVWAVTRGAEGPAGGGDVQVAQAPLWGLGRTLALEHPELWGGLVDLSGGPTDADALVAEVLAGPAREQTALRGGQRHTARLVRAVRAEDEAPNEVDPDGTYLITGGLAGLGLETARWLVASGARHLALVGRSAPGPRARATIGELERAGAAVLPLRVDVSDLDALRVALGEVGERLPPLRGVFHAAGVLEDGALVNQRWPQFERVLQPKVQGAWNLHVCTAGAELDRFVLYSSAAAVLGMPGQSSYAAGNAFLDALAAHRRSLGLPGVSIQWGQWSGVGMSADRLALGQSAWSARGLGVLSPVEGFELLRQAGGPGGGRSDAERIAFTCDWQKLDDAMGPGHPLLAELVQHARTSRPARATAGAPLVAALMSAGPADRVALLTDGVREVIASTLRLDPTQPIKPRQPLKDLGLDSMMAIELRAALGAQIGHTLPATFAFDYPTLEAMVEHVRRDVLALDDAEDPDDAAPDAAAPDELDALMAEIRANFSEAQVAGFLARVAW